MSSSESKNAEMMSNLKRDHESMMEIKGLVEVENLEIHGEVKKRKLECEEPTEKSIKVENENNKKVEGPMREMVTRLKARISRLKEILVYTLRVERMKSNIVVYWLWKPVFRGRILGPNVENSEIGVDINIEGENGHYEGRRILESFVNALQQLARNSTTTQSLDLPIEGTAANYHDNVDTSSGAQSTFHCSQVDSNSFDQEKDNVESSVTVFNDKKLLRTKGSTMHGHNVVLSSRNVQAACNGPRLGTNGLNQETGNKMQVAAGLPLTAMLVIKAQ
ncbi:hypothetical protein ACH5RR_041696 [Cinchona calisaya]|uniref:Uncharacterized protein n=1 Tax=Cinchona calisaya TaxID=153742 RepID=A0ABD2Y036_9GENT